MRSLEVHEVLLVLWGREAGTFSEVMWKLDRSQKQPIDTVAQSVDSDTHWDSCLGAGVAHSNPVTP